MSSIELLPRHAQSINAISVHVKKPLNVQNAAELQHTIENCERLLVNSIEFELAFAAISSARYTRSTEDSQS